ncbi:MAG TPA: ferritin family protein [Thermodesulfobacteriota bacterium]|nr:ferritin family protein [Thermodesulfobacteriota bacterium]
MDAKERINALEVALQNELREREFYLRNAKRTKNPLGKAIFQHIGDEELEHYEQLKELHKRWEIMGTWPETVPLKVKDTMVKSILLDMLKKAEEIPEGDADDLEAIRVAIDFEANGAKHYAHLRDNITDPQEKHFFDLLAKIENAHYLSLKDTEEFLTDPVSWYQKKEHHGLDGA